MRIITGSARGVNLMTLDGLNTRPTAERTKEAIFSRLQFDLEGRTVLDLFAGSGQMGLEALSRGAKYGIFCDNSRDAMNIISKNIEKTCLKEKSMVLCNSYEDGIERVAQTEKRVDIVFLDPPYASNMISDALGRLLRSEILRDGAIVVCESDRFDFDIPAAFSVSKQSKYGIACVTFLAFQEEGRE